MKKFILFGIAILCVAFLNIGCGQVVTAPVGMQPDAQYGTYNGRPVVYVTDSQGEQFMMAYPLFQSLFNTGGYNSVINYYYNNPNDYGNIFVYQPSYFHVCYGGIYNSIHSGYYNNYHSVYISHRVYVPSATIISSSHSVRYTHYGSSYRYRPSTTVAHSSYVRQNPGGSVSHVQQRTVFHSDGSTSQRRFTTTYHQSGRVSRTTSFGRRR